MYVCKSGDDQNKNFAQMELGDFFGTKRKIIFDLENPSEARKAERVLRPKGIRRHGRRMLKKAKEPPQSNKLIHSLPPSVIKTVSVKKNRVNIVQSSQNTLTATLEKTKKNSGKKKQESSEEIITSINIKQEDDKKEENPKKDLKRTKKQNEESLAKDQKKIIKVKKPQPPRIQPKIIEQLGYGGDLEVICPFCNGSIGFEKEDLDESGLENTRDCECGAILRISIRSSHPQIFKDLGIDGRKFPKYLKQISNPIEDEYGNHITTFGWFNSA